MEKFVVTYETIIEAGSSQEAANKFATQFLSDQEWGQYPTVLIQQVTNVDGIVTDEFLSAKGERQDHE